MTKNILLAKFDGEFGTALRPMPVRERCVTRGDPGWCNRGSQALLLESL